MEPPKSAAAQLVVGGLAFGAAAWVGATLNSRSVARVNPAGATFAAATGAVTGALVTLFAASAAAIGSSKWKSLGATTSLLGAGGFAALALVSLGASDRVLRAASTNKPPEAFTAGVADSGGTFDLALGDTITVELPAAQAGYSWHWSAGPAAVVSAPVASSAVVDGGTLERDTFTAATAGKTKLTALLAPDSGDGYAIATWTVNVTVAS